VSQLSHAHSLRRRPDSLNAFESISSCKSVIYGKSVMESENGLRCILFPKVLSVNWLQVRWVGCFGLAREAHGTGSWTETPSRIESSLTPKSFLPMSTLLQLDASPRGSRSHSRKLTHDFVQAWAAAHPGAQIVSRDLGHNPVPLVDEAWVAGAFTAGETWSPESRAAMRISNGLVDEFLAADHYVIASPMYNLSIPATLKAYIDQIVRFGRTFTMNAEGAYQPLVLGRKLLVVSARGGVLAGTPYDHQEPYLRAIFGFLGVTDVTFVHAEGLNSGEAAREASLAGAREALARLTASW
jgi:FMN-dependent NADH-azoreductase